MRFLTRDQIEAEYTVFARHDELPDPVKRCVHPLEPDSSIYDFATCLREGWQWVFDGWRRHQPKAWAALEACNPALLFGEHERPDRIDPKKRRWSCDGFVSLGDRYLLFFPCLEDFSIEHVGEEHPAFERFSALPEAIAEAHYTRINGVGFVDSLPKNVMSNRVLPAPLWTVWPLVTEVAEASGAPRKAAVNALRHLASGEWNRRWEERYVVMLDTRLPEDFGPGGDIVFVDQESTSHRLYHVRDFDFSAVALLAQPEAAIDSYVAHVISGGEGRFDFSPYRGPAA
jgi:hypothetical protein